MDNPDFTSRFRTIAAAYRHQKPRPSIRHRLSQPPQLTQTSSVSATVTLDRVPSSKRPLPNPQTPDTVPRTTKASSVANLRSSEIDLSGPLARLGITLAASNNSGSTASGVDKTPSQASETSLAEKLSKSFFDLTQGSQDRLQKWKTKLQSGKKQRNKDGSEPPGVANRKLSDLKDMDSLLNWTSTDKPRFVANGQSRRMASLGPRPLHASQSATNALSITDAAALETSVKRISLRDSADMEHRTLKSRENGPTVSSRAHYQNMKSLQHLVDGFSTANSSNRNSFIDMDLPPPARIMPYSGIKPQDNGIVRPVAFRPLNQQSSKDSTSSEISLQSRENSRSIGNLVASTSSSASGSSTCRNNNLFPLASSHSVSRLGLFSNATSTSSTLAPPSANDENDYDTVPDTYDRPCTNANVKPVNDPTTDNYDLIYSFQHPQNENLHHRRVQSGASNGSSNHYHMPAQNSSLTSSNSSSTTSGLPHSPPYSLKKSGSRHSGLHITPSPSDSGIVDFEFQNILRDKENELTNVRTTMEQNEEVLVRVYQDKERQYRDQLADLRAKLQASQQGEAALRNQLRMSDEKRVKMQNDIDALAEDKANLQRKCQTIERELYGIQGRFEDFVRDSKAAKCDNCARRISGNSIYENSMALAGGHGSGKAPVPTPRQSKDASVNSDRGNDDLRGQVDDLRSEISTLRNQLHSQMQLFADERRRWEGDRGSKQHI
uniref:SEC7 domain-containing protein n=1 Tax=Panagrellus redivivus TaxID=6233 RepID=A0A7E4ZRQ3_PANRE